MPFTTTDIPGLLVVEPQIFGDQRGYFFESYNEKLFGANGITARFVQDNQSSSCYGVVRGLHYQLPPHAQAKLIRVLAGTILDVVIDVRKGSPAYGKFFSIELSAENKKQLFIPPGFAHGFSVISEKADILYKCDNFYSRDSERGIAYNDPALNIDWQVPEDRIIVSEKDKVLPVLAAIPDSFIFGH